MKKALVIRFNAIGDLVLTTPVVEALAAAGYEVHYLVKEVFAELLDYNPHVHKVWRLKDSLSEVLAHLKKEQFDVVIDLHNNLRSRQVKSALKAKSYTLKKDRLNLFLLTKLNINRVKERHIVYRFLDVLKPLGIAVDEPAPQTYIPDAIAALWPDTLPAHYLVIVVGAAWANKEIPTEKIVEIMARTSYREIVLIGGPADKEKARLVVHQSQRLIHNKVGLLSITQSAHVISKAAAILSGDTGMMHIAASLGTPAVAVYGSTHPVLGYTPFYGNHKAQYHIVQNDNLNCRPCTKQGQNQCPKGHFKCMLDLDIEALVSKIDSFV